MQWTGFKALRTYERPLQNDLRELERFLRELNDRVGRNTSSEPVSGPGGENADLADHAFTHATQTATNLAGGTDPLGPWEFTWTHEHTFAPLEATRTPITIRAASAHSVDLISVQDSASAVLTVMDEQGDIAIGTANTDDAHLTVQGRAVDPELAILDLAPWGWWDANDPNATFADSSSAYSNGGEITTWSDKSGNSRHLPYDTTYNRKPLLWKTAASGTGSPANLPTTGLPVVGTVDAGSGAPGGSGVRTFGPIDGAAGSYHNLGVISWTVFVVARTIPPTIGNITYLGCDTPISSTPLNLGPNTVGNPDTVLIQYRSTGTQQVYSRQQVTFTSNVFWRFTFQRDITGAAHHIYYDNGELTTAGGGASGTPLTAAFTPQYLLRSRTNVSFSDFQNHLAEVLIFDYALDTTQLAEVHAYLDDKWGLENAAGGGGGSTKDLQRWNALDGTVLARVTNAGLVGIGDDLDPVARLHVVDTTEQLRLGYDDTNYLSATVGSTGSTTFDLTGTSPTFLFTDPVYVTFTTEQVRIRYDASNYFAITVASTGSTTLNLVGTTPGFTITDPVTISGLGAAQTPFTITANAAQVANLFEMQTSGGADYWTWGPTGDLMGIQANIGAATIPLCIRAHTSGTVDLFVLRGPSGSTTRFGLDVNGRARWFESSTPTHVVDQGYVYTKDFSNRTELCYFDSDGASTGVEIRITNAGVLNLVAGNFGNPTSPGVNLVGSNGTALTAMRSDAVLVLDQAIAPTWTGSHIWDPSADATQVTLKAYPLQVTDTLVAHYFDNGSGTSEPWFALSAGSGSTEFGVLKLGYLGSGNGKAQIRATLNATDAADNNVSALVFDVATTLTAAYAFKFTNTAVSKDYFVIGPAGTAAFGYQGGLLVDSSAQLVMVGATSYNNALVTAFANAFSHDTSSVTPGAISASVNYVSVGTTANVPTNWYAGTRGGVTVIVSGDTTGASGCELACIVGQLGIGAYGGTWDKPTGQSSLRGDWLRVSSLRATFIGSKASGPGLTAGNRPMILSGVYAPISPYVDGTTGQSWGVEIASPISTFTPTITPTAGGIKITHPLKNAHTNYANTRGMHAYFEPYALAAGGFTGNVSGDVSFDDGTNNQSGLYEYTAQWDKLLSGAFARPTTNGGTALGANAFGWSSLWLKDTAAAFEIQVQTTNTSISADRVLTIEMGDSNRTLDLTPIYCLHANERHNRPFLRRRCDDTGRDC